ncbi:hypothetical protein [Gorillibacterium sp. sgz5001074]|uniref:hypothetical protein n=1 Tax=Gorillibacterium sp. sgz5001074 TaxID=3446695 RepID=UPI003F673CD4
MVRIALSFFASIILLYVESSIVIKWMGYSTGITYDNYHGLLMVCVLNFFLSFSIFTQLMPWFLRINRMDESDEEEETPSST